MQPWGEQVVMEGQTEKFLKARRRDQQRALEFLYADPIVKYAPCLAIPNHGNVLVKIKKFLLQWASCLARKVVLPL